MAALVGWPVYTMGMGWDELSHSGEGERRTWELEVGSLQFYSY